MTALRGHAIQIRHADVNLTNKAAKREAHGQRFRETVTGSSIQYHFGGFAKKPKFLWHPTAIISASA